jgi:hypothetical protein
MVREKERARRGGHTCKHRRRQQQQQSGGLPLLLGADGSRLRLCLQHCQGKSAGGCGHLAEWVSVHQ